MPNVKIRAVHTGTNAVYDSQSNEVGQYRIPNLPIGMYRITFEGAGFKASVHDNIPLSVAQVARVDAVMQIGNAAETVEVTAAAPLLNTETPEVGTVLNNRTVTDLPLGFSGGRYAENFAYALTPGVAGNNWESRINGSPSFSKEVVLDGADASIYITGHMGESSPSMEALEEFKVQTSGMSAEFGRTGGGVFNFVMKSGTNAFHGSALGLIHNEWADANSFSNNFYGRPKRMDRRHDYGGSLGGPVRIPKIYNGRDKTFFYVAYERYKESFGGSGSPNVTVPLADFYTGNLSRMLTNEVIGQDALGRNVLRGQIYDLATTRTVGGTIVRDPFPGNIIPASRISQVSKNLSAILQAHYLPQVKDASGQVALFNNSFFPVSNQAGFTQDQFSIKGDQGISTAHKLSGISLSLWTVPAISWTPGVSGISAIRSGDLCPAPAFRRCRPGTAAQPMTGPCLPPCSTISPLGFNRQRNPSISRHIEELEGNNWVSQASIRPEISRRSTSDRMTGSTFRCSAKRQQRPDWHQLSGDQHVLLDPQPPFFPVRCGLPADLYGVPQQRRTRNLQLHQRHHRSVQLTQTGNGLASMLLGEVTTGERAHQHAGHVEVSQPSPVRPG